MNKRDLFFERDSDDFHRESPVPAGPRQSATLSLVVFNARNIETGRAMRLPRLRLVGKIALIGVSGVLSVAVLAAAAIYVVSAVQLGRRYDVSEPALRVTPSSAMTAEGDHLAHIHACIGCHGDGLSGRVIIDQFLVGRLSGPNLTRIVPNYTDQQIANLIRSGVRPDGTGIVFMPSHVLARLADADVAAIIAYLRNLEPRPDSAKDPSFGLLARALIVYGALPIEPSIVDRRQVGPLAPPADAEALGPYLAMTICAMCHGSDLHGDKQQPSPDLYAIVPAYSLDEFRTLMSTGVASGGRKLGLMTEISLYALKYMSDDEVAAVYAHLSAGAPVTRQ